MALRPAYGYQAQIAGGIAGLAEAAKEVSNGRLFTMSYYGYDTAVMALLLGREGIDGLSTVYEYKPITRNFSGPLVLPWMLMDGMAAAGKLMLVEDDTRTVLSCKTNPHTTNNSQCGFPGMRSGWTTAQTVAVLKRNFLTAAFHGAASYWYDMGCDGHPDGCFGGSLMPAATAALWGNLSIMTRAILAEATATNPPRKGLEPEVAIFLLGVSGPSTILPDVVGPYCDGNIFKYTLATQGLPVRWYLLEQLPQILPELTAMKLLIFPSATTMSDEALRAVDTLRRNGRTLAWTGVPAALSAPNGSSFSLARTLSTIGIDGLRSHTTPTSLNTRLVQTDTADAPRWPAEWANGLLNYSGGGVSGIAAPWVSFGGNSSGTHNGTCLHNQTKPLTPGEPGYGQICDFTVTIGAHDKIGHVWPPLKTVIHGLGYNECFRIEGCGCFTADCCGFPKDREQFLVSRNGAVVGAGHCCVSEISDFVISWERGNCSGGLVPPPPLPPAPAGAGSVAVLGTFADSGLPSVVWQQQRDHRTFYSANPDISGSLWRAVGERTANPFTVSRPGS
jgi:hypothetical protein